MTPKDKAKELVERFTKSQATILTPESKIMFSTIAALVCVDEIIKVADQTLLDCMSDDVDHFNRQLEYWQQVKSEIEAL